MRHLEPLKNEKKLIEKAALKLKKELKNKTHEKLEKETHKQRDQIQEIARTTKNSVDASNRRIEKTCVEVKRSLEQYEKTMSNMLKRHIEVEETLRNVLLAIRQNEYLQAWYPEQLGYSEMKVAGRHPAKTNGRYGDHLPRC